MRKLNPKNYDYLWSDYDINFIFVSCYLFKEFKKADIVLIYDCHNKELKFFLSKSCRKKLSDYGLLFYKKVFPSWKKKIIKNINKGKNLIEATKKQKARISSMNDIEIKDNILSRVKLFQSLGGNYFYTEFFFLDKIERVIKKQPLKYKKIIENIEQMGELKLEARKVLTNFYNYNKVFRPYIHELCVRTGRDDLQWLSHKEIFEILNGKKIAISDRGKVNWVLTKHNNWKIIKGTEAVEIMKKFDNYFFKKSLKVFKGNIANSGLYQGRVKIIRTIFSDNVNEEIKKVKRGDILVAATTGPEIMAACQRAGAIIADEGGITSHAAIVSRELGIPCIIGTKIATRVLKDADLVEVDAKKGIVKILKRAK